MIGDGRVTARPLDAPADAPRPPATVWRSFKDDRSYLYDLRVDGRGKRVDRRGADRGGFAR
ncbi:hypothetical protein [Streptomyces sp. NE5-10]|uniref:hypothetical protein n=1 Tax=Streptomyces sp. NE5-10 TaxID=2759674 RepID=UPI001F5BBD06|nr:hypothetical protein [Streptomyces sp. NE5-10]